MAINDVIFQALSSFSGTINDKMKAFYTAVGNGLFSGGGIPGVVAPGVLDQSAAAAPVTGTTNETALATIPIPAGAMGVNGSLKITTLWSVTNNANNKTLRVRLGGVSGTAFLALSVTTVASAQEFTFIRNRNSQASQVGFPATPATSFGTSTTAVTTATVDMSVAQDIVISGQLANAADTITLEGYTVEILNL